VVDDDDPHDPAAHGADERDSFDVVIPSMPGYAFSGYPPRPGICTARSMATLWRKICGPGGVDDRFGST
jgi:hypothetical protein